MAFITAAFAFIVANFAAILGVIGALLTVGAVGAKITPSPRDDRFFAAALRFFKLVPVPAPRGNPAPKAEGTEPPIMG